MTFHPFAAPVAVAVGLGLSAAAVTAVGLLLGAGAAAVVDPLPQAVMERPQPSVTPAWENEHIDLPRVGL